MINKSIRSKCILLYIIHVIRRAIDYMLISFSYIWLPCRRSWLPDPLRVFPPHPGLATRVRNFIIPLSHSSPLPVFFKIPQGPKIPIWQIIGQRLAAWLPEFLTRLPQDEFGPPFMLHCSGSQSAKNIISTLLKKLSTGKWPCSERKWFKDSLSTEWIS